MVDHGGESHDPVSKKTKRLIALTGNSHSPFSVASDLVRSPAISSQNTPSSRETISYSENQKKKHRQMWLQVIPWEQDPSVFRWTGKNLARQGGWSLDRKASIWDGDPALSDDDILLTHPGESSEGDGNRSRWLPKYRCRRSCDVCCGVQR